MTPFEKVLAELPIDDDTVHMIRTGEKLYSQEMRAVWFRGYIEGMLRSDPSGENLPEWIATAIHHLGMKRGGTA